MSWRAFVISLPSMLRAATVSLVGVVVLVWLLGMPLGAAADEPEWLEEFEDICAQTMVGDSLSMEELTALIERIDAILPVIQASDNPKKKVYAFRLTKCRSFFEYIMQLREEGRLEGKLRP